MSDIRSWIGAIISFVPPVIDPAGGVFIYDALARGRLAGFLLAELRMASQEDRRRAKGRGPPGEVVIHRQNPARPKNESGDTR
jgi:hypothetical protein